MVETNPAPEAPAPSEATPNTNSNPAPEAPAPEAPAAPTAEQVAQYLGTTPENLAAFQKFTGANGNFDKVFEKTKKAISAPQTVQQPSPAPEAPQTAPEAPQAPSQPPQPADGYITPTEIANMQYNKMLTEQYPEIAEYVSKGEYIKEASALGIQVVDQNGYMNDKSIRAFLDLKKAAVPAPAPSDPVTTTPLANYNEVEGAIDTREKAMQVMSQGEGHPQYKEAVEMMRKSFYPGKPSTKQE